MSRTPTRTSPLAVPSVDATALDGLRRTFAGDLISAEDPRYDDARQVWNAMVDRRPALVARCTGVADVRAVLGFARQQELDLTVRCGGHSIVGHGVADAAVVVDLGPMRGVRTDPERGRVWVQGGARLRDLDRETLGFGLGVPVGVVGDTGVGGLALGGGYGYATRRYGLTVDHLLAAEVVTADGELVVCDETRNPDLLWGLRGGGGNFGVVTGLELQLRELGHVSYGDHLYPVADGIGPLRALLDFLRDAPDLATASAVVGPAPAADWVPPEWHDQPVVLLSWIYHGGLDDGRRVCGSLAGVGRPVASVQAEVRYADLQSYGDVATARRERRYWKGALVRDLPDEALETILTRGQQPGGPAPRCMVEMFGLGGAFGRVGELDTAFGHRDSICDVLVLGAWTDPAEDEARLAEARALAARIAPWSGGAYVNSLEAESVDAVRSAYGAAAHDRLTALKDHVDPSNVFHHNQNVVPSVVR